MGKIFYLMGKSASGKDSLYEALRSDLSLKLKGVILYTTRPMREGEKNGREYFFLQEDQVKTLEDSGHVIEERCYQTVYGPWKYMTVDDGQFDLEKEDYLLIGTLESYRKMSAYFGAEKMVPLYIEVEDGLRLQRALDRERKQESPKYAEMCRRFLADEKDFTEEKRAEAGIRNGFQNICFEECLNALREKIISEKNRQ